MKKIAFVSQLIINFIMRLIIGLLLCSTATADNVPEEALRAMARGEAALEIANSKDDFKIAVKEFKKVVAILPTSSAAHFNLGLAYEKSDDFDNAIASYQKYLQLEPKAQDAYEIKKRIYALEFKKEQIISLTEVHQILLSLNNSSLWNRSGDNVIGSGGNFVRGRGNKIYNKTSNGAHRQQVLNEVAIQGTNVNWTHTFFMCGSSPQYNDCPMDVTINCKLLNRTSLACDAETLNNWRKDNSGTGSSGGRQENHKYSFNKK